MQTSALQSGRDSQQRIVETPSTIFLLCQGKSLPTYSRRHRKTPCTLTVLTSETTAVSLQCISDQDRREWSALLRQPKRPYHSAAGPGHPAAQSAGGARSVKESSWILQPRHQPEHFNRLPHKTTPTRRWVVYCLFSPSRSHPQKANKGSPPPRGLQLPDIRREALQQSLGKLFLPPPDAWWALLAPPSPPGKAQHHLSDGALHPLSCRSWPLIALKRPWGPRPAVTKNP